jgi:hypothetical protein
MQEKVTVTELKSRFLKVLKNPFLKKMLENREEF